MTKIVKINLISVLVLLLGLLIACGDSATKADDNDDVNSSSSQSSLSNSSSSNLLSSSSSGEFDNILDFGYSEETEVSSSSISGPMLGYQGTDMITYYFGFESKQYAIIKQAMSWGDAAEYAVNTLLGYLVEINTQAEQEAIFDAVVNGAKISLDYNRVAIKGNISYLWIGASDSFSEGTWMWDGRDASSGARFFQGDYSGVAVNESYINWGGTSAGTLTVPSNSNQSNGAAMALESWSAGAAGEWNDLSNDVENYFVVEID